MKIKYVSFNHESIGKSKLPLIVQNTVRYVFQIHKDIKILWLLLDKKGNAVYENGQLLIQLDRVPVRDLAERPDMFVENGVVL